MPPAPAASPVPPPHRGEAAGGRPRRGQLRQLFAIRPGALPFLGSFPSRAEPHARGEVSPQLEPGGPPWPRPFCWRQRRLSPALLAPGGSRRAAAAVVPIYSQEGRGAGKGPATSRGHGRLPTLPPRSLVALPGLPLVGRLSWPSRTSRPPQLFPAARGHAPLCCEAPCRATPRETPGPAGRTRPQLGPTPWSRAESVLVCRRSGYRAAACERPRAAAPFLAESPQSAKPGALASAGLPGGRPTSCCGSSVTAGARCGGT